MLQARVEKMTGAAPLGPVVEHGDLAGDGHGLEIDPRSVGRGLDVEPAALLLGQRLEVLARLAVEDRLVADRRDRVPQLAPIEPFRHLDRGDARLPVDLRVGHTGNALQRLDDRRSAGRAVDADNSEPHGLGQHRSRRQDRRRECRQENSLRHSTSVNEETARPH